MRRDFAKRKENVWKEDSSKRQRTEKGWDMAPTSNADFEEYYKMQNICPSEEWETMLEFLQKPLPLTFRINGSGRFAEDLRQRLESDFFADFQGDKIIEVDGEALSPPLALPWYPDKLAWQLDFSRNQLRKLPRLEALHEFMKRETEIGSITRQEAVSMVPPLFLDVQPHHRVLDMCAAPGSKTMQLLEALHADPFSGEPTGVVVANDADTQRCNMLAHQAQRMRSPALIVTNHEAQSFPQIWDLDPTSSDVNVKFDRILADVPCSGDGTVRKQPDIYRRWSINNGNGLHMLQLRIGLRGCELLKVGGRLVYSTCTFNPIEDEAVVAEILRRTNGAMELLDVSNEVPKLRRQPGLRVWRVKDKDKWYDTWEDGKNGYKLDPSMFPPATEEEVPLERCMRYLPQHQNTGGFFVAVLKKVSEIENLCMPNLEHRTQRPKSDQWREMKQTRKEEKINETSQGEIATTADSDKGKATEPLAQESGGNEDSSKNNLNERTETNDQNPGISVPKPTAPKPAPPAKVMPEWGSRCGRQGVPPDSSKEGATDGNSKNSGNGVSRLKLQHQRGKWHGIDPIVPFIDEKHLKDMQSFFGLSEDCPILSSLIARNIESRPKRLNYLSSGSKKLLQMDYRERLKVTIAGVKIFERQEDKNNILGCSYRVAQEGLAWFLPHAKRQVFYPTMEEFLAILTKRAVNLPQSIKVHISTNDVADNAHAIEESSRKKSDVDGMGQKDISKAQDEEETKVKESTGDAPAQEQIKEAEVRYSLEHPKTIEQLSRVDYGGCIAILHQDEADRLGVVAPPYAPFAVSCWRGRGSLNVLVSKQECIQMAERLQISSEGNEKS